MIKRFLAKFGYRLERIVDAPSDIVEAFSLEIDGYTCHSFISKNLFNTFSILRSELLELEDLVYKDTPRPELIRLVTANMGSLLMHVAAEYGELLPRGDN